MKKRIAPFAYFFICFAALLMLPAKAYLDPSVTTYVIQVVAGVAVAVGATIGIYWRLAKKKVQNKLGIDENAKKEVEDELSFDEDENAQN